jgi:hypothetical protein
LPEPDAFRYRLDGHGDRRRSRRNRRSYSGGNGEVTDVTVNGVLRDLQIELQVLVHHRGEATRQLHAPDLLVIGGSRHDGHISHVGVVA